jgi:hypothetical protein
VAQLLLEKLREMDPQYPPPDFDPDAEKERLAAESQDEQRVNGE